MPSFARREYYELSAVCQSVYGERQLVMDILFFKKEDCEVLDIISGVSSEFGFGAFVGMSARSDIEDRNLESGVAAARWRKIVFNFEVTDSAGIAAIYIFNAVKRLKVDSIGRHGDSLLIRMPFFDSYFTVELSDKGEMNDGIWTKNYVTRVVQMPFHAVPGESARLTEHSKADFNVDGTWETSITGDSNSVKAIGIFNRRMTRSPVLFCPLPVTIGIYRG